MSDYNYLFYGPVVLFSTFPGTGFVHFTYVMAAEAVSRKFGMIA
jgi:hypothetical protein